MSPDLTTLDIETKAKINAHVDSLRKKYGMDVNGDLMKSPAEAGIKNTAVQPAAVKAFSDLSPSNSKYYSTGRQLKSNAANFNDILREINKADKNLGKINFRVVETPGVIPRILAEAETIMKHFNTGEQPRVDKILDSANGNLDQTRQMMLKINGVLGEPDTGGILHAIKKYDLLLKIGLAIVAVSVLVTAVLVPLTMLRIILFGL